MDLKKKAGSEPSTTFERSPVCYVSKINGSIDLHERARERQEREEKTTATTTTFVTAVFPLRVLSQLQVLGLKWRPSREAIPF
jgi:hypothetical protein